MARLVQSLSLQVRGILCRGGAGMPWTERIRFPSILARDPAAELVFGQKASAQLLHLLRSFSVT